ncbi:two-component system response regulator RgbR [Pseudolactococcus yaeyamensis]
MIKIAICDDEPIFLEALEKVVLLTTQKMDLEVEVVCYTDGYELLEHQKKYALFFLDIDMPKINGFELAEKLLKNKHAKVVMVTSYEERVFEAFRYQVFRFIPKPAQLADVAEVLESYEKELAKSHMMLYNPEQDAMVRVKIEDFEYIESVNKKVSIIVGKQFYHHNKSMKWWLDLFDTSLDFLQIERSFLVNLAKVKRIVQNDCHMENGQKLPIAVRRRKEVKDQFEAYLFRKMSE